MGAEDRPAAPAGGSRGAEVIEAVVEQRIAASPSTVFSYLVDPDKFVLWMGAAAEIDPRPGGVFRLDVDGEHIASGRLMEVDPPHRIVLTFGWEGSALVPPGSSTVEITLEADGGNTLLRLRHRGLPTEAERDNHAVGWSTYLSQLALKA